MYWYYVLQTKPVSTDESMNEADGNEDEDEDQDEEDEGFEKQLEEEFDSDEDDEEIEFDRYLSSFHANTGCNLKEIYTPDNYILGNGILSIHLEKKKAHP